MLMGKDSFAGGGWWHDPSILKATGQGIDKEEPRAWQGWWNERVVQHAISEPAWPWLIWAGTTG